MEVINSLYALELKKWYQVFPKEQICLVRTEDYEQNKTRELKRLFDFLDLGKTIMTILSNFIIC